MKIRKTQLKKSVVQLDHQLCFHVVCVFLTVITGIQCTSEKAIILKSDLESEVFVLDSEDNLTKSLGKTPVRLVNPILPLQLTFRRPGHRSVDFVAFDESSLVGEVQINVGAKLDNADEKRSKIESKSFDGVARAHRFLLRGKVADARRTLDDVERTQGAGGFSAVALRGHMELFEGRIENFLRYYLILTQSQGSFGTSREGSP